MEEIMKMKSVVIAGIIFAILGSVPLFSFKDVKKINKRPVTQIVQVEEVKEIRSISIISNILKGD
jgi:hypothetical protein